MSAEAIAALRAAFPGQDFPDDSVVFYVHALADLDSDEVDAAIRRIVNRSVWLPKVAEIRIEVAEERLRLPTVEEAWDIACKGDLKTAPPEVRASLEAIGGRSSIIYSDNVSTLRAQFRRDYEGRREYAIHTCAGAAIPTSIEVGAGPRELMGPTMASLPETERVTPRPIHRRWLRRMAHLSKRNGEPFDPPTDEERADALEILRDGPLDPENPADDGLYLEAERVMAECSGEIIQ